MHCKRWERREGGEKKREHREIGREQLDKATKSKWGRLKKYVKTAETQLIITNNGRLRSELPTSKGNEQGLVYATSFNAILRWGSTVSNTWAHCFCSCSLFYLCTHVHQPLVVSHQVIMVCWISLLHRFGNHWNGNEKQTHNTVGAVIELKEENREIVLTLEDGKKRRKKKKKRLLKNYHILLLFEANKVDERNRLS